MTTRLQIYNGALLDVGEPALASLSENREARHLLDTVWNDDGVRYCLEQAQWHFAMRASHLTFNPSIDPPWGFPRAFDKPSDWVTTSGVFRDEFLRSPLLQYADEVGYWFADVDDIYVKYVSNATTYGMDLARWPSSFTDYVKAYFASRICSKMPGGLEKREEILKPKTGLLAQRLLVAKNKSAMSQPATFPSRGTWAAARHAGNSGMRYDGGNPNSLHG